VRDGHRIGDQQRQSDGGSGGLCRKSAKSINRGRVTAQTNGNVRYFHDFSSTAAAGTR